MPSTISSVTAPDGEARSESDERPCPGCGKSGRISPCGYCGVAERAGGYQVQRVLSENDHARVYLARSESGQAVVLKELVFSAVPSSRELEAFDRETRLLEALDHPRVPRFLGRFREGDGIATRLYLAQTYVEGVSLTEERRRGPLSEEEILHIAIDLLNILEYLHGRQPKVVHRDVKPANIIRAEDGRLWLVDFGAARLLEGAETRRATFVGSFGYMPIEQFGGTVDETVDLYALGATLLYLFLGREPATLLTPDMRLQVPRGLEARPATRAWIERLTAPRGRRFASASAARRALPGPPDSGGSWQKQLAAVARSFDPRLLLALMATLAAAGAILVIAGTSWAGYLPAGLRATTQREPERRDRTYVDERLRLGDRSGVFVADFDLPGTYHLSHPGRACEWSRLHLRQVRVDRDGDLSHLSLVFDRTEIVSAPVACETQFYMVSGSGVLDPTVRGDDPVSVDFSLPEQLVWPAARVLTGSGHLFLDFEHLTARLSSPTDAPG